MNRIHVYRRKLFAWYRTNRRDFPWRETSDPYAVLVGEVLLQRTRGENAAPVYARFLERFPDIDSLSAARTEEMACVIRPLGLVKRAEMLQRLGRALAEAGGVPTRPEVLITFPGVGRYAAHSVQVYARRRNLPVVDWVVARVLRRYFGLPEDRRPNVDEPLWDLATRLATLGRARDLWFATFDLAAAVCKPRPLCGECPLRATCVFATAAG